MWRRSGLLAVFIAALAVPALAQAPQGAPMRIRGTVTSFSGEHLVVKSRDGKSLSLTLPASVPVAAMARRKLSDIKKGDFIGSAAAPGRDGKLHAQEVLIFPEAMRGTGEGHYPWDLTSNSTMTNAAVSGVAQAPNGRTLNLDYKGGSNAIIVGPHTPIVSIIPGDRSLLKPGAAVFAAATKQPDGSLVVGRITAEKDGVKPPM